LRLAKGQKAECPNCRASLTPLQPAKEDAPPTIDYSGGHRAAIIARSAAARNAVRSLLYFSPSHYSLFGLTLTLSAYYRLGIMRRENERLQELSVIRDGNKENI
jgi:hypothetical protein